MNLALVYGGDSSEWEVSVWSGQQVASQIDPNKYAVYEILLRGSDWKVVKTADGQIPQEQEAQIDKTDFSFLWKGEKLLFGVAVIMIHGTPGENGVLQSYFEMLGIPYTSSNSFVSALAFDKYACKCYLRDTGILMPKELLIREGMAIDAEEMVAKLGLPFFVKPNKGGSSFGATKVKCVEEIAPALASAFKECSTVLVEEFIEGRELTNGILKTYNQQLILPVTEIVSKNDFFDYQAKYQGASDELTPAPISDALRDKVQQLTSQIYDHLECHGFIRIDYIAKGEELVFLEVNTIPGMTQMSLVPQQVRAAGISMEAFLALIIEDAMYRFGPV